MKHKTAEKISLKVLRLENSPRDTEIIRDLLTEAGYDLSMDCTMKKSKSPNRLLKALDEVLRAEGERK